LNSLDLIKYHNCRPGRRLSTKLHLVNKLHVMSISHPLKTFLQLQLASDNAAVLNLPYVIQFLSPQHLQPSPHLQKWLTRINSLVHSKHPGARWAGLSIACQTAIFSRELLLENSRSWVSAALPLLSVRVSIHTFSSSISLCIRNKSLCQP
jgi:rRNA processing/ribosome biogenesis